MGLVWVALVSLSHFRKLSKVFVGVPVKIAFIMPALKKRTEIEVRETMHSRLQSARAGGMGEACPTTQIPQNGA